MSQLIDPSIARQFDRLPPHSIEAEMCLIASMMAAIGSDDRRVNLSRDNGREISLGGRRLSEFPEDGIQRG